MPIWSPFPTGHKKGADYPLSEEQLKGLLKRYDADGDGRLSQEELQQAFKALGLRFSSWRACRAFRRADTNRDGYISEDEMAKLVSYAKKWGFVAS